MCFISIETAIMRIAIRRVKKQVFFKMDLVNPDFLDLETQTPHFPTAINLANKKKKIAAVVLIVS